MSLENEKARTIKANRMLQAKVGMGPIDEKLVEKSQKLIENNKVDFAPMAKEYLDALEATIKEAREGKKDDQTLLQESIEPVMQLKANAAMFDYVLVGNLANIMMNFLETVEAVDKDVIDIADAHWKTLTLIIGNEMKGDGGQFGKELTGELKDACKRYFARQASHGNLIEDRDAFFVDG